MVEQVCLLYSVIRREHGDPLIEELNPGDALEPEGRGTGKAPDPAQHNPYPPAERSKKSGSQGVPATLRSQSRMGMEESHGPKGRSQGRRPPLLPSPGLLGEEQDLWGGCCFSGHALLCRDEKVEG